MITPSGRFIPKNRLCLSISDYHPETWNPAWSVGAILTGLLSFMLSEESASGVMESTESEKQKYARESRKWNQTHIRLYQEYFDNPSIKVSGPCPPMTSSSGSYQRPLPRPTKSGAAPVPRPITPIPKHEVISILEDDDINEIHHRSNSSRLAGAKRSRDNCVQSHSTNTSLSSSSASLSSSSANTSKKQRFYVDLTDP